MDECWENNGHPAYVRRTGWRSESHGSCWMNKAHVLRSANQSVEKCFWTKFHLQGGIWRESCGHNFEVQHEKCIITDDWSEGSWRPNGLFEGHHVAGSKFSHSAAYQTCWDTKQMVQRTLSSSLRGLQLKSNSHTYVEAFSRSGATTSTESDCYKTPIAEDYSSSLPDDILEKIFTLLPLLSLLRGIAVCKRWRRIICSESFMTAIALSPPHKPWYLMYRDSEHSLGVAYDPSTKKWHEFSLPCFDPFASFAASANGLACFMDKTKCGVMYVCNPMTKMWRKLPKPASPWISDYSAVDMIVKRKSSTYKVVVARSTPVPGDYGQWDLSIEIYDSILNCWSTSNTRLLQGWRAGEESKICKGVLYCVCHSTTTMAVGHEDPRHGLIAYDLTLQKFHDIMLMPCSLSCARLVSCKDNLIMVGGIGTYDFIKGVGIWELDGIIWKQIGRMPTKLFHGFAGGLDDVFSCGGHGDLIFIHSYGSPQLIVYDLISGTWNWARTCPVLKRDPLHLFTGFCFEPRLNATV